MVLESMKEETCTKINLRLALTFTLGAGKSRRSSYSKVFFFVIRIPPTVRGHKVPLDLSLDDFYTCLLTTFRLVS